MKEKWRALLRTSWVGPLLALLFVYALFTALSPETFARGLNLVTMLRQTVVLGTAAVGMALIIVLGGIDLSVGSTVALTTVIVARSLRGGGDPTEAVLAGLAIATLTGFFNGCLTAALRITPFIVTLGTMSVLRGAAKGLANEQRECGPGRMPRERRATAPPRALASPPSDDRSEGGSVIQRGLKVRKRTGTWK